MGGREGGREDAAGPDVGCDLESGHATRVLSGPEIRPHYYRARL